MRRGQGWIIMIVAAVVATSLWQPGPAVAARCTGSLCTDTFSSPGTYPWKAPQRVLSATFAVAGAAGGDANFVDGGLGGRATATLALSPGEVLQIVVGGEGDDRGPGGFNGGGAAGWGRWGPEKGGGGASDLRRGPCAAAGSCGVGERVIVGGGGGGAVVSGGANAGDGVPGAGGHPAGGDATDWGEAGGGSGGSQTRGGAGGAQCEFGSGGAGAAGTLGAGGAGGDNDDDASYAAQGGGGGGGGLYGGGGGGSCGFGQGGPGGGGSSAGPPGTTYDNGVQNGGGLVVVTFTTDDRAPVCEAVALQTDEDQPREVAPACSDPEGDPMTPQIASHPTHGQAGVVEGRLRYVPNPNFSGTDSFTYIAGDGLRDGEPATVSVTVRPVDDGGACADLQARTQEDASTTLTPQCEDPDATGLTYEISSAPENGTATVGAGRLSYTPSPDFHGTDRFRYRSFDGTAWTAPATVTVDVAPVNDAPACDRLEAATDEDRPVDLTPACRDADGDALSYEITEQPEHGRVTVAKGALRYEPAENFHGEDGFRFRAADDTTQSAARGATVQVASVNDAPVCAAIDGATDEDRAFDLAPSCSDADGDPLTYEIAEDPSRGTATVVDGWLRYTPARDADGTDRFAYRAADGFARSPSSPATLVVRPVDDPAPQGPAGDVGGAQQTGGSPRPRCDGLELAVLDAQRSGNRVRLRGIAAPMYGGQTLRVLGDDRVIKTTTAPAAGRTFTLDVPVAARYRLRLGGAVSRSFRLQRSLRVLSLERVAGGLRVRGRLTGARAPRLAIRTQTLCGTAETSPPTVPVGRSGAFSAVVARPHGTIVVARFVAAFSGGRSYSVGVVVR